MPRKERNRVYYLAFIKMLRSAKTRDLKLMVMFLMTVCLALMIWCGMKTDVVGTTREPPIYGDLWAQVYIWVTAVLSGTLIMFVTNPIINGRIRPFIREYLATGS